MERTTDTHYNMDESQNNYVVKEAKPSAYCRIPLNGILENVH